MPEERIYEKANVVSFFKTDEKYGKLSNMKGKFELCVNNMHFTSSEAIYQALKFPENTGIQKMIAAEKSPMTAKRIARTYKWESRTDWEVKKVCAMRIVLRIKALQCKDFYELLLSTGSKEIVEVSRKDDYWGAFSRDDKLIRKNVLGRFLMELRQESEEQIIAHMEQLLKLDNNMKINEKFIVLNNLKMI